MHDICGIAAKFGLVLALAGAPPEVLAAITTLVEVCQATGYDRQPKSLPLANASGKQGWQMLICLYLSLFTLSGPICVKEGAIMGESDPTTHARFIIHYSDTSADLRPGHAVHFHTTIDQPVGNAAVIAEAERLRDNLAFILTADMNLDGFHYARAGSNLTFAIPGVASGVGSHPGPILPDTGWDNKISFVGRTEFGHNTRMDDFGIPAFEAVHNKLPIPSGDSQIDNFVTFLNAEAAIIGADGGAITWYPYINIGHSKYWLRKSRV
jgi:hypothetical protein